MRELCEHMLTWELFSENEVKSNLQQALDGLAAQQEAWSVYQGAQGDFSAGLLDQGPAKQQALRQLEAGEVPQGLDSLSGCPTERLAPPFRDTSVTPLLPGGMNAGHQARVVRETRR